MSYNRKMVDSFFYILLIITILFTFLISHGDATSLFGFDTYTINQMVLIVLILFMWFAYRKINSILFYTINGEKLFFKKKEKELIFANQELITQLYVDSMTNLNNRTALERDMRIMENPKLIILNIDSFKSINEYYGNEVGNFLLCKTAECLQEFALSENLKVYRIDGDEFALLENCILDIDRYESLANALIYIFANKMFDTPDLSEKVEINVTLGFSLDRENTLEKAAIALKEAKKKQIHYLCYFAKIDKTKEYLNQKHWSKIIKRAIENNRVIPFYQPIFNKKREVVKYECLARIVDEHDESITPNKFLDVSKKVKRYAEIEKIVIEKSFISIENNDKIISINLLARDMSDSNVSNFIISMLNKYKVSKRVIFEILEEENIKNFDRITFFVNKLKSMGCKIAIDDFGTGYSNFEYLMLLKPDYLKLDGTLIKNIDTDKSSFAMINSIVAFAKKAGIKTIAEYVKNEKIFQICLDIGVDEFQGFYLAGPTPNLA